MRRVPLPSWPLCLCQKWPMWWDFRVGSIVGVGQMIQDVAGRPRKKLEVRTARNVAAKAAGRFERVHSTFFRLVLGELITYLRRQVMWCVDLVIFAVTIYSTVDFCYYMCWCCLFDVEENGCSGNRNQKSRTYWGVSLQTNTFAFRITCFSDSGPQRPSVENRDADNDLEKRIANILENDAPGKLLIHKIKFFEQRGWPQRANTRCAIATVQQYSAICIWKTGIFVWIQKDSSANFHAQDAACSMAVVINVF